MNRLIFTSALVIPLVMPLFVAPATSLAGEGDPVAIRYWPNGCSSIETMWNIHVAFGTETTSRSAMPRPADVEFVDDFWEASSADKLVLDRKPNETKTILRPSSECPDPSRNAIRFTRIVLKNPATGKSVPVNVIAVDGVTLVDSNKNSVSDLVESLKSSTDRWKEFQPIDVLMIDSATASQTSYAELQTITQTRNMVLRNSVTFDKIGDIPIEHVRHNTIAISKSDANSKQRWIKLDEAPWSMDPTLAELFEKKESVSRSSRDVFAVLSPSQMNFQPGNGTHTPRWNAEHMMGRELLFFSQIYHAVDPNIPILDLNPKQMPTDYRPVHADWTGLEESLQIERVECFTRRFAYLLQGMDLDKTAKGSAFWTPKALLKQMAVHYSEHTANVRKKMDLPNWPKD
jgi:hypothetical protein